MPRACNVCNAEEHRLQIDERLRAGTSASEIAKQYGFSPELQSAMHEIMFAKAMATMSTPVRSRSCATSLRRPPNSPAVARALATREAQLKRLQNNCKPSSLCLSVSNRLLTAGSGKMSTEEMIDALFADNKIPVRVLDHIMRIARISEPSELAQPLHNIN